MTGPATAIATANAAPTKSFVAACLIEDSIQDHHLLDFYRRVSAAHPESKKRQSRAEDPGARPGFAL
jgi:hypothetical protein